MLTAPARLRRRQQLTAHFLRLRSVLLPLTEATPRLRRHLPRLADLSGEDWGLLLVLSTRGGLLESGPRPLRHPAAGCF